MAAPGREEFDEGGGVGLEDDLVEGGGEEVEDGGGGGGGGGDGVEEAEGRGEEEGGACVDHDACFNFAGLCKVDAESRVEL